MATSHSARNGTATDGGDQAEGQGLDRSAGERLGRAQAGQELEGAEPQEHDASAKRRRVSP